MISRRALAATVAISLGAIALSGCATTDSGADGNASSSPSESAADPSFNDQDVMFAQMMIPHHAQAIDMAEILLAKDDIDPQVTELAERIRIAQGPEIELMTSWLESWDESVEGSGHSMEGVIPEEDMQALEAATGDDAARLFLDQMIAHHMGAVSMADTEIESGRNADATALAQQIVDDQRAEIETMTALLQTL